VDDDALTETRILPDFALSIVSARSLGHRRDDAYGYIDNKDREISGSIDHKIKKILFFNEDQIPPKLRLLLNATSSMSALPIRIEGDEFNRPYIDLHNFAEF